MRYLLVMAVALLSAANAKDAYEVLKPVSDLLKKAESLQIKTPDKSLDQLLAAEELVKEILPTIETPAIKNALPSTFRTARQSVIRQTLDLKAQTGLILALLRKATYDDVLDALIAENKTLADQSVVPLAQNLGWDAATIATLKNNIAKGNIVAVQKQIESFLVDGISKNLAKANTLRTGEVYQNLTEASNLFLMVQDSPRVSKLSVQDFNNAIVALTKGENDALPTLVAKLNEGVANWKKAL